MNVGRLFREEGERREAAALLTKATAPRTWLAMLDAWEALMKSLCVVLGVSTYTRDVAVASLHLATWRWMWSLPPCSKARKAAFTMGAAALLIERWREASTMWLAEPMQAGDTISVERITPIGQRAESLLRIAAWHIDDARGEAHARTLARSGTSRRSHRTSASIDAAHRSARSTAW